MEFSISRESLHGALSVLAGVAAKKSTMPILQCILLRTDGKSKLLLAATDLMTTITMELPCKAAREGGMTLSAKQLAEVVGSFAGEEVSFIRGEGHKAELRCGRSRFAIMGFSEKDYPKLPESKADFAPVDAAALVDLIDRALYAISPDETRLLHGGNLKCTKGLLRIETSDGHRGVIAERQTTAPDFAAALVPKTALAYLRRAVVGATELELARQGDHLMARTGSTLVSVKLLDHTFPSIQDFIRAQSPFVAVASRLDLLATIKRIALVASAKGGSVDITLDNGSLTVSAESDAGNADETIPVSYSGKPHSTRCNAAYFAEALDKRNDEEVRLEFDSGLGPLQIRPVEGTAFTSLVMPMRE